MWRTALVNIARPALAPRTGLISFRPRLFAPAAVNASQSESLAKALKAVEAYIKFRREEIVELEKSNLKSKHDVLLLEKTSNAKLNGDTKWSDLGMDMLDEVEAILAIEDALGIHLTEHTYASTPTIESAVSAIIANGRREAAENKPSVDAGSTQKADSAPEKAKPSKGKKSGVK